MTKLGPTPVGDTFRAIIGDFKDVDDEDVTLTGATVTVTWYDRNGTAAHSEVITDHSSPAATNATTVVVTDDECAANFKVGLYEWKAVAVLADGETWTQVRGVHEFTE